MKFNKDEMYLYGIRDVVGFEGRYAVTSCGRVWSYSSGRFLTPKLDKDGYYQVGLYDKFGKQHWLLLHRLVAKTYISNPDSLSDAAHIDECSTHNWIGNLEWSSHKDNCNAPLHKQRIRESRGQKCFCIEQGLIYPSIKNASEVNKIDYKSIYQCCRGKQKTAGGYHWEYVLE